MIEWAIDFVNGIILWAGEHYWGGAIIVASVYVILAIAMPIIFEFDNDIKRVFKIGLLSLPMATFVWPVFLIVPFILLGLLLRGIVVVIKDW